MSDASPRLSTLLREWTKSFSETIHTALPGRVTAYDASTRSATVVPTLADMDGEALPQIFKVPVAFPGGGGFSITCPLLPGDLVLLICAERSIEDFIGQGADQDPLDVRRHALTDAIAIPILWYFKKTPNRASQTDLVIGRDNGTLDIRITQGGKVTIGNEISGVELLDILDRLLAGLTTATAGGQPLTFTDPTLLATLIAELTTIKGSI